MREQSHWRFCRNILRRLAPPDGSPFRAAEIGCASGGNAVSMLREFPTLTLWMIDPWKADPEYVQELTAARSRSRFLAKFKLTQDHFDMWHQHAVNATAFAGERREILRMESSKAAGLIADSSLAFVFIDGDHREAAVWSDLEAYWPKVQPGGIFAGHDYGSHGHAGVIRAVDQWVAKVGLTLLLPSPRCWMVEKSHA